MKKCAKTAKQKPSNLGRCPKWKKGRGARLVNKWKQRGDDVSITCLVFMAIGKVRGLLMDGARERTGQFSLRAETLKD